VDKRADMVDMARTRWLLLSAHASVGSSLRLQWLLFVGLSTALAFSQLRLLFWFYAGFFLAEKIGDLLAGRNFLALPSFLVGFIALRIVAEHVVYYKTATVFPSAIAAALIVGAVISSRDFMRWTELPPVRFLGRVSFSSYLLHMPIFYLCTMLAVTCRPVIDIGNVGVLLVTTATTLVAAAVSYRYVEIPAMRSGKYLSVLVRSPVESMARRWRAAFRSQGSA
jgi:peptidoglycan/LPS O-acetylase OafA/YrhL